MLKLYSYWRSTASYRVRIALHLKGQAYETAAVHLLKDGGEQRQADYTELNPQQLTPTLVHGDVVISQSLAAIEYLDEVFPEPSLLPGDAAARADIRKMALAISMEVHPLNNLRVLQYITGELGADDEQKNSWYFHWLKLGFDAMENWVSTDGPYCAGEQVTLADLCLIPQLYNAHRFKFDMSAYQKINKIEENCLKLDAFQKALPENQPDAV